MTWMSEVGAAIKVGVQVALQGGFWAAMGRALLTPGLLLVAAVLLGLYMKFSLASIIGGGFSPQNIAMVVTLLVCVLLIGPLLMQAWSPVAARAAAASLDMSIPEHRAPSLAWFIGIWLLVSIVGTLLAVAWVFIPRPFSWAVLLPAALLCSGYQVRSALCIHTEAQERSQVLSDTFVRRTVFWFPICTMPLWLYQAGEDAIKDMLVSPYDIAITTTSKLITVMGIIGALAVFALVLVLWSALALQALAERHAIAALSGRRVRPAPAPLPADPAATPAPRAPIVDVHKVAAPAPAARVAPPAAASVAPPAGAPKVAPPRTAPVRTIPRNPPPIGKWIAITFGVLIGLVGLASLARVPLMHQYLVWNDADYAEQAFNRRGQPSSEALATAFAEAGCDGNLPRIKLFLRLKLSIGQEALDESLICAARTGKLETAVFLISKKANVNAMPAEPALRRPSTALQHAVLRKDAPMVDLLISERADVALQAPGAPAALHFAATNMDAEMIATLIREGARPDAPVPMAPIFYYAQSASHTQDTSAAMWQAMIAKAERAGLSISGLDAEGGNLLHWAADRGQLGLIDVLLARGLDRLQQTKGGAMPFMQLANWYRFAGEEPGPQLEFMLKALTSGVPDINVAATVKTARTSVQNVTEPEWTIARAAAAKPRVRAVFGERVNYAMLGGPVVEQQWPLQDKEQAGLMLGELSAAQVTAAPALAAALRAKGWDDLAVQAESKR